MRNQSVKRILVSRGTRRIAASAFVSLESGNRIECVPPRLTKLTKARVSEQTNQRFTRIARLFAFVREKLRSEILHILRRKLFALPASEHRNLTSLTLRDNRNQRVKLSLAIGRVLRSNANVIILIAERVTANIGTDIAIEHRCHAIRPATVKRREENAKGANHIAAEIENIKFSGNEETPALKHSATVERERSLLLQLIHVVESFGRLNRRVARAIDAETLARISTSDVERISDNVATNVLDGFQSNVKRQIGKLDGFRDRGGGSNVLADTSEVVID